jgi:hypothetical protein
MEDQVRNKRMTVEEFIRGAKEKRKIKKEESKKIEQTTPPSKGMSVEEFISKVRMKRGERKKKLNALESVLEKAVAVKRIGKFVKKVEKDIVAKRDFDNLVFY